MRHIIPIALFCLLVGFIIGVKVTFNSVRKSPEAVYGFPEIRDSLISVYKMDGQKALFFSYYIGLNADRYKITWQEITAIARIESNFDQLAVSDSGALGVLQILPSTGFELCQELKLPYPDNYVLYLPEYSFRCGTYYLSKLKLALDGSFEAAAKSYYVGLGDYYAGNHKDHSTAYWQRVLFEYNRLHK